MNENTPNAAQSAPETETVTISISMYTEMIRRSTLLELLYAIPDNHGYLDKTDLLKYGRALFEPNPEPEQAPEAEAEDAE